MLKNQMLTLMCVLGILACGGCMLFIPAGNGPVPHPPPPVIPLQGVRSIEVIAASSSDPRRVDPALLAQAVVTGINRSSQFADSGVKAKLQKDGIGADAVLKITVLSETLIHTLPSSTPARTDQWTFLIRLSATLTRRDGMLLWQANNIEAKGGIPFREEDSAAAWKELDKGHWLPAYAGFLLVRSMAYGN